MANEVKIQKTVFNKEQSNKLLDTEFKTFTQSVADEDDLTVQEFFNEYRKLYYEIPLQGEDSHETLIQESLKLVDIEKDTQDIQPLLDEIAQLRQQNLELTSQVFTLEQEKASTV